MQYIFELLKLFFVLGIIIAGGYFILNKIKETRNSKVSVNRMMQVIDSMPLGFKDQISLIKIGEEYIVKSESTGQMLILNQKEIKRNDEKFEEYFEYEKTNNIKNFVESIKGKVTKVEK